MSGDLILTRIMTIFINVTLLEINVYIYEGREKGKGKREGGKGISKTIYSTHIVFLCICLYFFVYSKLFDVFICFSKFLYAFPKTSESFVYAC